MLNKGSTSPGRRMLPFDGMRGIAAVGVTAFHVNPTSPFMFWAWTFVDMFFVLSGFLIGTILYRGISEGTLSLKNFWIRRILRIWPVYYLMLAVVTLWTLLSPELHMSFKSFMQSLVFLQFTGGYIHPGVSWNNMMWHYIPWFSHSWSIAVEEQFYLLLPILLWMFGTRARGIFLIVIAALALSQFLLYADFVPNLLGTRMQGLALGLLLVPLSQWLHQADGNIQAKRRSLVLLILAVSFAIGLCTMVPLFMQIFPVLWNGVVVESDIIKNFVLKGTLGMALIYFAIVGFVVAFPKGMFARMLSTPVLVYLGGISYGLYMIHVPVEGMIATSRGRHLSEDSLSINVIYWIVILSLAALSKILIEDRFNAYKDRYPVFSNTPKPRL
ncbi:acyltransferase family protein [Stenotrophobium rhamnosiphilum]|uniref:acyltransferase family protein n=1 Tax=Stenotrophobium rhamnosiphilum TaxID=2029166 RepID=UPI0013752417|nr:acyltransferase [Stenotrophobium rhamnosiphilum]